MKMFEGNASLFESDQVPFCLGFVLVIFCIIILPLYQQNVGYFDNLLNLAGLSATDNEKQLRHPLYG
jgi:hypothetical protein